MPQQAQVRSVDALDSFRSSLIVYLSQARPALEEVTAEVVRTRVWLETEQRTYWENQVRRRRKELEQAQQALFSARLGNLRRETSAELMTVQRAKRAFDEAETKLRILKKWNREFEGRVQPLVKQMEKLHTVLSNDMVKAVAYLALSINTLAAYAELHPAAPASSPPPSGAAEPVATADTPPAEAPEKSS
jgi:hypothetical protein